MYELAENLIATQNFTNHMGIEVIHCKQNDAFLKLPYKPFLGEERVNGGAIASLIDLAATCAFWCYPQVKPESKGATISLNINFMKLVRKSDIFASGIVKRRGSSICVGIVEVESENNDKIAIATATYKLNI